MQPIRTPLARRKSDSPPVALLRYLGRPAVHTYAFSVAACAILSLFPFMVLLLTIAHSFLHSKRTVQVVAEMFRALLPTGQEFVVRNMVYLVYSQRKVAIFSVFMLLVSSTGVFLPLEVALNQVWGVTRNRSYLRNQLISLGLAFAVGLLAMSSVALSVSHERLLTLLFFGHTGNLVFQFLERTVIHILAVVASIAIFFLIYWILPNRKIRVSQVLPAAIVTGLFWEGAKICYIKVLPMLDLRSAYGPFSISVGLMLWAFLSGLILLAGAQLCATVALRKAAKDTNLPHEVVKELTT